MVNCWLETLKNTVITHKKQFSGWLFLILWGYIMITLINDYNIMKNYIEENICMNYCDRMLYLCTSGGNLIKTNLTGNIIIPINITT